VDAGDDPEHLADIVANLRHHQARSQVALTIWVMREAVGHSGADPAATATNNSNENPADRGRERGPTTSHAGCDRSRTRVVDDAEDGLTRQDRTFTASMAVSRSDT
jgi:hypothetical protein